MAKAPPNSTATAPSAFTANVTPYDELQTLGASLTDNALKAYRKTLMEFNDSIVAGMLSEDTYILCKIDIMKRTIRNEVYSAKF